MSQARFVWAEDLHFFYGTQQVLHGIDVEVRQGEMLGLVGPNGAGKSTFLRIVSGALKPKEGAVYVNGVNLCGLRPKDRARLVAMVSQHPTVLPFGFTALETVLMGRNPYLGLLQWEGPEDLEIARRVMELTDTWQFAHRAVSSLSGGERQRVFIARALAQEAPLLLLDEPTAHLDIAYQSGIFSLLQAIRTERPVTVLTAIHDLTLAAQYCDRVAVLHQGAIFALGRPIEVVVPEVVFRAFGTAVSVVKHPVDHTPVVLLHKGRGGVDGRMHGRYP